VALNKEYRARPLSDIRRGALARYYEIGLSTATPALEALNIARLEALTWPYIALGSSTGCCGLDKDYLRRLRF
jgi:hypothetical protein